MKTKGDIQVELLKEIDEICSNNGLNYVLVGLNSLNAYLNHTIRNGNRVTSIAMTQGDIDRFCEIVERDYAPDRYVEGMHNNPRYLGYNFQYGNDNTMDYHVINLDKNIHHGINIKIYPIRKSATLDGEEIVNFTPRLLKEQRLRRFMNKIVKNKRFWYVKDGLILLNGAYSLTGGGKRYFKEVKRNSFIDKWEDIQKYSMVRVGNKQFGTEFLKSAERYDVDGMKLPFPTRTDDYFTEIYNEEFRDKKIKNAPQRKRDIVDTEYCYNEILDETEDILNELRATHEEVIWERKKFTKENETIQNLWRLVKMTDKQIQYIDFFDKNYEKLSSYDMDNPKEYDKLSNKLAPVIKSLRGYAKHGMTFSISPEADELIEKVLIKEEQQELVDEMKKISKKKYFVE